MSLGLIELFLLAVLLNKLLLIKLFLYQKVIVVSEADIDYEDFFFSSEKSAQSIHNNTRNVSIGSMLIS